MRMDGLWRCRWDLMGVISFLRKTFSNMCYTLYNQCSVDVPKERCGDAIDCALRSNPSLGWVTG